MFLIIYIIVMDTDEKMKVLEEENARLKEELQTTKEHLKKYTAPSYKKEYYEKNKEKVKKFNFFQNIQPINNFTNGRIFTFI